MKLAISGKGGTGKSTLAAILAHFFRRDGYSVLAVDADPDANLASALGILKDQASRIIPISEDRPLIKERTGANAGQFGQLFKLNPTVSDIPDRNTTTFRGIKLLVMGGVRKGGSGCACPENVLLRNLLSEIVLNRDEVVIVDMEAGIEHLGRGTARAVSKLVIMVEPGSRSIQTARTIMKLADEIGLHSFGIVGNKIQSPGQKAWLLEQLPPELFLGMIPYHEAIRDADLRQEPLIDLLDELLSVELERIYRALNAQNKQAVG